MRLTYLPLILLPCLFACRADAPRRTAAPVRVGEADPAVVAKLPHRGSVVQTAAWKDRLGVHTLLLTEIKPFSTPDSVRGPDEPWLRDAELYAYDYVHNGAAPKLLWRTTDFQRACEWDLVTSFIPRSLAVTDLDRDGIAEVTFLYTMTCTSDVAPSILKLIMREGEAKYAIRGTTRLQDPYGGGEMILDPSFATAPPAFREHAVQRWSLFVGPESASAE